MTDTTTPAVTPEAQAVEGQELQPQTVPEQPKSTEWTSDSAAAEIKALRAENAKHRKAAQEADRLRQEAETAVMAEQGKYRELYEKAQAQAAKLEADLKDREMALLRQQVAISKRLPSPLADRLRGETLEELEADADAILQAIPKPAAPSLDGRAGGNGTASAAVTDEEIEQLAARWRVKPEHIDRAAAAKMLRGK